MNKFIIEKAIIEKTEKDIVTDCDYNFTSGLNLICGANEVGKSSLIDFLNTALFIKDSGDEGKVFVKFLGQNYLVETRTKHSKNIIYSLTDDKKLDNSVLKQQISAKEFSNVFSINIDDLMCVKEKDAKTFINLMKDSSCEYLNSYVEKTRKSVNDVLGSRNVINDTAKLKAEILSLNKEIKEYSDSERNYNNVVSSLNTLNEELQKLSLNLEKYSISERINELDKKIKEIEEEYKSLAINFNSNLVKNSVEYLKLNEKALSFNNNLKNIIEKKSKIDELNSKILFAINKLKMQRNCF